MNWIEAVVLGIVQGLTEFLPVSSSGHLVLFQHFFGLVKPELLFDICVHVGTLAAVLIVLHQDIIEIGRTLVRIPRMVLKTGSVSAVYSENPEFRLIVMIMVGCVPTALLGLVFAKIAQQIFGIVWLVGIALMITGTLLWYTRQWKTEGRPIKEMMLKDAFIIGLVQGMAILPGISRSGATISAAIFLGVDRELAGRFSFLLTIPTILGALVFGLDSDVIQTTVPLGTIIVGSLAAAMVGYLALVLLLNIVKKGHLYRFAPYCWIVGAGSVIVSIIC